MDDLVIAFTKEIEKRARESYQDRLANAVKEMPRAVLEQQFLMAMRMIDEMEAALDREREIKKRLLMLAQPSMQELNGLLGGLG